MKKQFFIIIGLVLIILLTLTIISYIFNLIEIINFSNLFSPKYDFIQRLILLLPYSFALALLIFFVFFSPDHQTIMPALISLISALILAVILLEFIYSTQKPIISPYDAITEPIERQEKNNKEEKARINSRLRQKIDKNLDIIFYHGNYQEALKLLETPIQTIEIKVPENRIIEFLISTCKNKIAEENKNIIEAKRFDPDFDRGYKHLMNKNYSYAERYFRNNITHQNRYFHQKALLLLQRQGQLNLTESMQELTRIRQLKELGKIFEKSNYNNPRIMYEYFIELHSIYGEKGMTSELSHYSKLISIDEITKQEIETIKSREKRTNLIYSTDVLITDKKTGGKIQIKKALLFIRASYFIENSHLIYFENILIIKDNNIKYTIELSRISKDTGIFNNLRNQNQIVYQNGIISFGTEAVNIINFKPALLTSNKLSTLYYLSSKTDNLYKTIMKSVFKERMNYYTGFIILFILTYLIAFLISGGKNKKEKINKLFYILPFLIIIIASLLLVHFSYYISNTILQQLM